MSTVWRNLELLEETYEQIFLKTHRIQANRVCLGDLTGVDFLGEKHPVNCPCEKKAEKDRLDRERLEQSTLTVRLLGTTKSGKTVELPSIE